MNEIAYLNGQFVRPQDLLIPADDAGFAMGATIVERLRTFRQRVFRQSQHLQRLRRGLHAIGLDQDTITKQIADAIDALVKHNAAILDPDDDLGITAFVTPGRVSSPPFVATEPTVAVQSRALPFATWQADYQNGQRLVVSSRSLQPVASWPRDFKCRSRIHYYLAELEAKATDPGAHALLLDLDGTITETSMGNLIRYTVNEGFVSPPLDQVLPGVSLQVVAELAQQLSIPMLYRRLAASELMQADELLITSTPYCVLPVTHLDQSPIGSGRPGPVFHQILSAWSSLVGVDIADQARRFATRVSA